MWDKLEQIDSRYREIDRQMADPAIMSDLKELQKLAKEKAAIDDVVTAYREYRSAEKSLEDTKAMVGAEKDEEMAALIRQEVATLERSSWVLEYDDWKKVEKPEGLTTGLEVYPYMPAPGTRVWIVGFPAPNPPQCPEKDKRERQVVPARVVHSEFDHVMLLDSDDKSDLGGMSGGPVCTYYEGRMVACGVFIGRGHGTIQCPAWWHKHPKNQLFRVARLVPR